MLCRHLKIVFYKGDIRFKAMTTYDKILDKGNRPGPAAASKKRASPT